MSGGTLPRDGSSDRAGVDMYGRDQSGLDCSDRKAANPISEVADTFIERKTRSMPCLDYCALQFSSFSSGGKSGTHHHHHRTVFGLFEQKKEA